MKIKRNRIVKDNFKKIMFQAVPKLKHEVARRQVFIQGEKHNVEDAVELEKIKGDVLSYYFLH